ncbi:MAG TPA: hypothetical protein VGL72_00545 [Bryobacteraceae bacterium]
MTRLSLLLAFAGVNVLAQSPPTPVFKFAVSGDSRNCGDVVMPAIAASVLKSGANFYWHLGDFRAIYDFDEDMVPPARLGLNVPHLTIANYLQQAWPDFISHQLTPFGSLEIFLGIGNHETIYPKTHAEWIAQFDRYLNTPRLRTQRQNDKDTAGGPRSYYHWVMNDVDFLSLDNATGSTFDATQMAWIRRRLAADQRSRSITTVVVGMHEALPGSKGMSHSMCDAPAGVESGRAVYKLLWTLQQSGKKVYVLASHSHFVMDDIYNTAYWKDQVLPGWIVGTAGAVRYRLPAGVPTATIARTDVYGYLLATVMSDGSIHFDFRETGLDELRRANQGKIPEPLIRWCYAENRDQRIPAAEACTTGTH